MTDTITRQAFEAWAKSKSLNTDHKEKDGWGQDRYSPHIESMWAGWQAALAAPKPPVKQADDWEIRGQLTALKCWHRLTEAEADDLVVFTAMLTGANPWPTS